MLFRRLSKHVREENWFAVSIDFFIVVVGILIAFQITEWSEARGDKALANDLIARMSSEAITTRGELQAYIKVHRNINDDARQLPISLNDSKTCSVMDDTLKLLIVSIADFPPPRFSLSNAQQALETGSLALIRSDDIRAGVQVITDEMAFIDRQWQRYVNVKQNAHQHANSAAGVALTGAGEMDWGEDIGYDPTSYEILTPEHICGNTKIIGHLSDVAGTQGIYVQYLEQVEDALDVYINTLNAKAR